MKDSGLGRREVITAELMFLAALGIMAMGYSEKEVKCKSNWWGKNEMGPGRVPNPHQARSVDLDEYWVTEYGTVKQVEKGYKPKKGEKSLSSHILGECKKIIDPMLKPLGEEFDTKKAEIVLKILYDKNGKNNAPVLVVIQNEAGGEKDMVRYFAMFDLNRNKQLIPPGKKGEKIKMAVPLVSVAVGDSTCIGIGKFSKSGELEGMYYPPLYVISKNGELSLGRLPYSDINCEPGNLIEANSNNIRVN